MTDLPNYSVLVSGLDDWFGPKETVSEPRLAAKVARVLELPGVQLLAPPLSDNSMDAAASGVRVYQFPEWFVTQNVESRSSDDPVRSRVLVHRKSLVKGKYLDQDGKKSPVVPVRFVRACPRGHIGDIDWYAFVHNGGGRQCRERGRQLFLEERGTSGDLTEQYVRCECGEAGSVAKATVHSNRALGFCDGARPWLGPNMQEPCTEPSRLLFRSASNAYFPQLLSVISLPERSEKIREAVNAVWDFLESVEDISDVARERRKSKVKEALEGLTNEEVWAEINARRGALAGVEKSVKQAELETLVAASGEVGEDRPEGIFYAKALPRDKWDEPWMASIERVVLVHRLREVVSLLGFTRFEAFGPDTEGEIDLEVRRAALASPMTWVPTQENRGEGLFLQFRREAIREWSERGAVNRRANALRQGFDKWKEGHPMSSRTFPGSPYILLHSFAHLLLTAVSLECGYPASSIRERIYAIDSLGYGVLLYTGSSDSEGTLGGLVDAGRRIAEMVGRALEIGELCSNDPVCAQHSAADDEARHLHGAACHGCVLISETSCEQQNDFLDRALVVRTVDSLGTEFFPPLS